ncbi:HEAT repeat domain-containing protein [Actinomadura coerulea]|uniref:HEAT repeat domain-containing protein n=1 Tax=Actinomadura coerulea TaxID=46159 RepID=UPI003433861A
MSTDMFGIRVLANDGLNLTVRVYVVYDDESLPNPALKSFFFCLLTRNWLSVRPLARIEQEIGDDWWSARVIQHETGDYDGLSKGFAWMAQTAQHFVQDVTLLETRNHPGRPPHTFHYLKEGGWSQEELLPQGVYRVTATDPKWIEHLSPGDAWATAFQQYPRPRHLDQEPEDWKSFVDGIGHHSHQAGNDQQRVDLDAATVERLTGALDHANDYVAWRAAQILGAARNRASSAVPRLAQALGDANPDVQAYAVHALGRIGDAAAAGPLITVLWTHDPSDWRNNTAEAAMALAAIGPDASLATDALRCTGATDDIEMSAAAAFALYRITGDESHLASVEHAFPTNSDMQRMIIGVLLDAPADTTGAMLPLLTSVLEGEHNALYEEAQWEAAEIVGRMGSAARSALTTLHQLHDHYAENGWSTDAFDTAIERIRLG